MEFPGRLDVKFEGLVPYRQALQFQINLHAQRTAGLIPDCLVLLEHPLVITRGRRTAGADILASPEDLASRGIEVVDVERGGEATLHGPGQLVGYPVVGIEITGGSVREFVFKLEEVFIRLLSEDYGITAGRDVNHHGVWVGADKIVAIGLAVRRRVTFHGFAFNINTQLEDFGLIVPCGIHDHGVTSLERLVGRPVDLVAAAQRSASLFRTVFGYTEEGR
jgi:lipoyl(octanoyl) transferase